MRGRPVYTFGDIPQMDLVNDRIPILDMSESGQNRDKLISPANLLSGVSVNTSGLITTGDTGAFYSSSNPSGFINQSQADNRYVNISGDVISGNLRVSGVFSGDSVIIGPSGYIDFSSGIPPWKAGRVFYDENYNTLAYYNDNSNVTINIGQENVLSVRNGESFDILNGQVVYISGAQGNRPKAFLATAHYTGESWDKVIGIATHDISNIGYITTFGIVNNLNTTGYVEGDHLFLSPTSLGNFTNSIPSAPNRKIQIGTVLRSHQTQGSILVSINQGEHLWNLHDVLKSNYSSGQILMYNGSGSSGYWEAQNLNTGIFATNDDLSNLSGNLSNYATLNYLNSVSGNLQSGIDNFESDITFVKVSGKMALQVFLTGSSIGYLQLSASPI